MAKDKDLKRYWKTNLDYLLILLSIWFVVSYLFAIVFVDQLNQIRIGGFKLGFWFAQQGSIYVFVALIFVYMSKMNAMDKKYGVDEERRSFQSDFNDSSKNLCGGFFRSADIWCGLPSVF